MAGLVINTCECFRLSRVWGLGERKMGTNMGQVGKNIEKMRTVRVACCLSLSSLLCVVLFTLSGERGATSTTINVLCLFCTLLSSINERTTHTHPTGIPNGKPCRAFPGNMLRVPERTMKDNRISFTQLASLIGRLIGRPAILHSSS